MPKTHREVRVDPGLDEHEVWADFALPALRDLPGNEGIFFTCRMFDYFWVRSGTVSLHFKAGEQDWWMEDMEPGQGSTVWMEIAPDSKRTTKEVFDRFAGEEAGFELNSTVLSIRLLQQTGGGLVSRSQAKRLLARTETFKTVVLDFGGVSSIGPAFADEIFRVFARNHPAILLVPVDASADVARMIARAIGRANGETPAG